MQPRHRGTTVLQGRENQPVVIFDDFLDDPAGLVEDASFLRFDRLGDHYPGVRAHVPAPLVEMTLAALGDVATEVFGVGALSVVDAFYSLVTTGPDALRPIQRLPHFDGVEHERLALLHYLSRDERGGTAFYRHRTTGFESVDAARLPAYRAALDGDLAREGLPDAAYIAGDTPLFQEVGRHRGVFNRAILYRSNTLHCARLPADAMLPPDPATGRFTINTFLTGSRL